MQALVVDHHRQLVDNALANRKPVKVAQDWRDVVELPGFCRDTSCSIESEQPAASSASL